MPLKKFIISCVVLFNIPLYGEKAQTSYEEKKVEIHTARAYLDKGLTELYYTEKHHAFYKNERLVRTVNDYFLPSGEKIGVMESDYTRSMMMPTYVFENYKTSLREGLEWKEGAYFIFVEEKNKKRKTKELKSTDNIFSCQGWHYFILKHFDSIQEKETKMNLIFPSELDHYSFRLKSVKSDPGLLQLKLQFDNWFVRLFAPELNLTYDKARKKLVKYIGPTNLLSTDGSIPTVHIVYE